MTRAQIADPHMVVKIRDGREDEIKQCVGANYCIDRQYDGLDVLCVQNAATTRETTMPHRIAPTRGRRRRIVVVGAGPAGMEAARVSAERGHEVVLLESNAALGGQILLAARGASRWRASSAGSTEIKRLGIDCRLGQAADADDDARWIPTSWCWPPARWRNHLPGAWPTAWPSAPGTCWRAASSLPGACWSMTASAPTQARGWPTSPSRADWSKW